MPFGAIGSLAVDLATLAAADDSGQPIALKQWGDVWAEDGAVFMTTWLTPPADVCKADRQAYKLLLDTRGITWVEFAKYAHPRAPAAGWRRIEGSRVVEFWWLAAQPFRLGARLPTLIKPCPGVDASYALQAVYRIRPTSPITTRAAANVQDVIESPVRAAGELVVAAADAVGEGAGKLAGAGVNAVVNLVLPVLIPVGLAYLVWRSVQK
jgi:hypothetical protein